MIRSISSKGTGFSITFGTNDVRDLSNQQFPVELWRVWVFEDGHREEELRRTCKKKSTLARGISHAGAGHRFREEKSWVELRTPKGRSA